MHVYKEDETKKRSRANVRSEVKGKREKIDFAKVGNLILESHRLSSHQLQGTGRISSRRQSSHIFA